MKTVKYQVALLKGQITTLSLSKLTLEDNEDVYRPEWDAIKEIDEIDESIKQCMFKNGKKFTFAEFTLEDEETFLDNEWIIDERFTSRKLAKQKYSEIKKSLKA